MKILDYITVGCMKGGLRSDGIRRAIKIAKRLGSSVTFIHNGVQFLVSPDDDLESVYACYNQIHGGRPIQER